MVLHSLFLRRWEPNILLRNDYIRSEQASIQNRGESLTTSYTRGKKKFKDRGSMQEHFPRALPQAPALGHFLRLKCLDISEPLIGFIPDLLIFELMLPTVCPVATTSTDLATYPSRNCSLLALFHATLNFMLTKSVKSILSHLFPRLKRSTLFNYPSSRSHSLALILPSPFTACFTVVLGFLRWQAPELYTTFKIQVSYFWDINALQRRLTG